MKKLIALLLIACVVGVVQAEETVSSEVSTEDKLRVAISVVEPDVVKVYKMHDGLEDSISYSGFDIELWEKIAKRAGLGYEYTEVSFKECFSLLREGKADVSISGITINQEREKTIDFSHSYMDAYLGILVEGEMKKPSILPLITKRLFTLELLKVLGLLFSCLFVFGFFLWAAERGEDAIDDDFLKGFKDACWCAWAVMTTIGFGDIAPKRFLGRILTVPIFIFGCMIVGIVSGPIISAFTVRDMEQIHSEIRGPEDLRGKKVATLTGTTSVPVLENLGADVVGFDSIEKACEKLLAGEVDAVVYDSPPLLYYSNNAGKGKVSLVGSPFEKQNYGFALQQGSVYREKINQELLRIKEDGTYDKLYKKWFGE